MCHRSAPAGQHQFGQVRRGGLHTLKLSPQEQLAFALGLENLKPPATIAPE